MIPKIIHQIWEGHTEYLEDTYKSLGERWKKFNHDWIYEFWNEIRMDNFVYNYFSEMVDIYFGYPYAIQRWHVIRYLILYKIGGLYVNFDYECMEPFSKYILDENKCYFAMEPEQHCCSFCKRNYFNNALMIAPPSHPFFNTIITHLQSMSVSYTGDKELEVLNTTGLLMLTSLYEKYANKESIVFFPAELVSSLSKNEMQDYFRGKIDEDILEKKIQKAIAIHYFNGSWLNKSCIRSKKRLALMPIPELYQIFTHYPVICIDEKTSLPDSLFFFIKGFSYDENEVIEKALKAGYRYVIVDDPLLVTDDRYILVDNVLKALEQLADYHHQMLKTPVIGITGTCGKTTTKELVTAVLSTKYKQVSTHENENSTLGASLTLLSLKPEHEIAVIEMAACHLGMIRELARIVRPEYGIITNVGLAHLEVFGSLEGVLRTMGELYDYLRQSGGKIFIHKENEDLQAIGEGLEMISYGESKAAFVSGQIVTSDPCLCFNWENVGKRHTVTTHIAGGYNLFNALAAIAVGVYFDVPVTKMNQAISEYVSTNYRSQWKKTLRNELIIDTFNANPCSMHTALINLSTLSVSPKAVILGDMLELGTESLKLHIEIIEMLNEYDLDKVFLCDNLFTATRSSYPSFSDVGALSQYLSVNQFQGYNVLIKGSNKIHLEMIVHLL